MTAFNRKQQILKLFIDKNLSNAFPLYYDIDGAPFKVGDDVKVLDNPNFDETFNTYYSLKSGLIVYLEYTCGCGQRFPEDPMIGVEFKDGTVEEFWKEELQKLNYTFL